MQIRYHCPTEQCVAIIEYEPLEQSGPTMKCPRCAVEHPMGISDVTRTGEKVDRCAVCGATEMFVRKDFPQALGLVVAVIFVVAALYYFTISPRIAWSILAGAALFDLLVYSIVGKVTTCYACRAEYRKCAINPSHEGFDLATSEKY